MPALKRHVLPALLYLFLAIASTWPLAGALLTHLPLGMEEAATVPLFNVWTVWWNADRAASGFSGYWDAPIFYPTEKTFAFSEPMPLSVLVAPIIRVTGNRILAYNCLLFLILWLNGWVTFHFLKRLHMNRMIALLGGAMMALLPLAHSWVGVIQLVAVFGIVWSFLALYQFGRRPTVAGGIMLGTACAVTYLMCAHFGLVLLVLLTVSAVWLLGKQILQLKMWTLLLPGIGVYTILCLPIVLGQYGAVNANDFFRPEPYLAGLSAHVADYCASPWRQLIHVDALDGMATTASFKLCPGFLKLALMAVGVGWGLLTRRRRSWTLFCLTILCAAFILSLGPNLHIFGWKPYMMLIDGVPGFGQVRNVFRSAIFVQVSVVLLAVMGLQAGVVGVRRYMRRRFPRWIANGIVLAAGLLAVMEIWPPPQPLHAMPSYDANQGWIEWLQTRTPPDSVVACVPFPFKPFVASYEQEAEWLYWGTFHERRMPNGYSSYFPRSFLNLKMHMAEFPTPETIGLLCDMGVNYCVVSSDSYYGHAIRDNWRFDERIEHVFCDRRARIDIYRLTPDNF
jgi:hypothetical protein